MSPPSIWSVLASSFDDISLAFISKWKGQPWCYILWAPHNYFAISSTAIPPEYPMPYVSYVSHFVRLQTTSPVPFGKPSYTLFFSIRINIRTYSIFAKNNPSCRSLMPLKWTTHSSLPLPIVPPHYPNKQYFMTKYYTIIWTWFSCSV